MIVFVVVLVAKSSGKNGIPVITAPDDFYVLPVMVMMTSLFENANPNTFYEVFVMVPGDFKNKSKIKIYSLKERYKTCEINFIDMILGDWHVSGFWPASACYRLHAASLLTSYKRCIHMDCDVIVRHDLSELYDTNIDGYYFAGVINRILHDSFSSLGLPDIRKYINSGILIMNLEIIREDKVEDKISKLFDSKKQDLFFPDNDVINIVGFGKILFLPMKYNYMINVEIRVEIGNISFIENEFSVQYSKRDDKDPSIIHFAGEPKPWDSKTFSIYHEEFWIYTKMINLHEEMEEMVLKGRRKESIKNPKRNRRRNRRTIKREQRGKKKEALG